MGILEMMSKNLTQREGNGGHSYIEVSVGLIPRINILILRYMSQQVGKMIPNCEYDVANESE